MTIVDMSRKSAEPTGACVREDLNFKTTRTRTISELVMLYDVTQQLLDVKLVDLLREVGDLGFSWYDIARICEVSVSTVRQWRTGTLTTGDDCGRVYMLVALCRITGDEYHIEDAAGWLETPVHPDAPITGLDMLVESRYDLVLKMASTRMEDPERVLDEFQADWRERYKSNVEVFTASDGLPGLCIIQ